MKLVKYECFPFLKKECFKVWEMLTSSSDPVTDGVHVFLLSIVVYLQRWMFYGYSEKHSHVWLVHDMVKKPLKPCGPWRREQQISATPLTEIVKVSKTRLTLPVLSFFSTVLLCAYVGYCKALRMLHCVCVLKFSSQIACFCSVSPSWTCLCFTVKIITFYKYHQRHWVLRIIRTDFIRVYLSNFFFYGIHLCWTFKRV